MIDKKNIAGKRFVSMRNDGAIEDIWWKMEEPKVGKPGSAVWYEKMRLCGR